MALEHIHIRNFTIVDSVDIDFASGMTTLTGETGAGKSILLDALGLCLGDRAEAGLIPESADRAEINAQFNITANQAARDWLHEHDLYADGECVLRRVLHRNGRSQAWLNGRPVPLQLLDAFGRHLVDIHGQHAHQSLMRRDTQRETLDDFGDYDEARRVVAETYNRWQDLHAEVRRLEGGDQAYTDRLGLLRFQVDELAAIDMTADDIRQLDGEQRRLAAAGSTIETCQRTLETLYNHERSAQSLLSASIREIEPLTELGNELRGAHELLNGALVQLEEGCQGLRHFAEDLEIDPQRLQWVEDRITTLNDLARKHHVNPHELPERLTTLRTELEELEDAQARLKTLETELSDADRQYREAAATLHDARQEAATTLAGRVNALIAELGMTAAKIRVSINHEPDARPAPHGLDSIGFEVCTNPDQPFGSLQRVASGGELSRIGLALAVATANVSRVPTLIFDEADTGIGGAVAEVVGRKLRELGGHVQVLCVTHLPQVAAQAHHQLRVRKSTHSGRTRTRIDPLMENQRTQEIARMLGGVEITDNTLNHAREMLDQANDGIVNRP